ncbi:MAG: Hsp33 family molecular chaperone HslO [Lachnospiraceae bacterium]|nr:Hsp33 family molecular chaperone HslO [Lachnospiraceae bacterium]
MTDTIIRATVADASVRAFAASTCGLVECARIAHGTSPVATAALGRLLTAGAMMGCTLKNQRDLLTLQIRGDGPIGGLTVTADSGARVKGYVNNPLVMLPPGSAGKLDVGRAVGAGYLNVIKDMGLKEPYSGQVTLQSGEIAEDLTYYFAVSEQIPSIVGLGVLMEKDNTVRRAGGFIVQLMPFVSEKVISHLTERLKSFTSVTDILLESSEPEYLLSTLLGDMDMVVTEHITPSFYCNCDKERVEKALISIGHDEIRLMVKENEPVEVKCQFCNSAYVYDVNDLNKILCY